MMIPYEESAFRLMSEGSQALAEAEHNGMRIDRRRLESNRDWAAGRLREMTNELRRDQVWREWSRIYGERADYGSREQLGDLLFNHLGFECKTRTKTGKPKTDASAFEHLDISFLSKWETYQKLLKVKSTYLDGILFELDSEDLLHPVFNLHFARTFRSSSDSPNFQNMPNRDKRQSRLVRSCFVPRQDHVLVELDYGALEFRGAACFWQDPAMIRYASDDTLDIHRDMAAECYLLSRDEVSKPVRGVAKNSFVFPELYGSWWKNCAKNLWEAVGQQRLHTESGASLREHLHAQGLTTLEEYSEHVQGVEESFNKRFSHWAEAKENWWKTYLSRGWFPLKSGFVCKGVYSRNNLMNYPIQGPSFHLLLWSFIQLNKWLKKHRMRSLLIGQIHDSIVGDIHKDELQDVLNKAEEIMTEGVRNHWDWVVVPLIVEAEVAETTWFEKQEYARNGSGYWTAV